MTSCPGSDISCTQSLRVRLWTTTATAALMLMPITTIMLAMLVRRFMVLPQASSSWAFWDYVSAFISVSVSDSVVMVGGPASRLNLRSVLRDAVSRLEAFPAFITAGPLLRFLMPRPPVGAFADRSSE